MGSVSVDTLTIDKVSGSHDRGIELPQICCLTAHPRQSVHVSSFL